MASSTCILDSQHCVLCVISTRLCGVSDPSWSELTHFVQFLDLQLRSSEMSVFFQQGDVLAGLKSFVVKFMVRMSMVCVYV